MGFKPLKFLGKLASKLMPIGGGLVADIISPKNKSQEQIEQGLASLDPIAQYNRTMARPKIALACVYSYLGITVLDWLFQVFSQLFKFPYTTVKTPETLEGFATIAVGAYMGSRGIEKIVSSIFKKKKRKKKWDVAKR